MKGRLIIILLSLMTFATSMAQDDNILSCPDDNHPHTIDLGHSLCAKRVNHKRNTINDKNDEDQILLSVYDIFFTDRDKKPIYIDIIDEDITYDFIMDIMGDSLEVDGYFSLENSNASVASVDLREEELTIIISPLSAGKTTILVTHKKSGKKAEIQVTVFAVCPDSNHPHIIDFGLPSGTKWACCNVGADAPEESGGYFAWGEIEEKEDYCWYNYKYSYSDNNEDGYWDSQKDTGYWHGSDIGSDISGTEYDVAHVKLGGNWQIPTPAQFKELVNYCWNNGGVVFNITEHYTLYIGSTGQMIIFPYCGSRRETALIANERWGYFWTSTAYTDKQSQDYHDYTAEAYIFDSSRAFDLSCYRFQGFNVRPVINATNNTILPESSSDTSNQSIYNIYGIKVADKSTDMNTLPPGIYIVNGRKMVVK